MPEKITEKTPELLSEWNEVLLRMFLIVLATGVIIFVVAAFVVGPMIDAPTIAFETNSQVNQNNWSYDVLVLQQRGIQARLSLEQVEDRYDVPNVTLFVSGNRVLLRGVQNGQFGDGSGGSHSDNGYRPFIYDLMTGQTDFISDRPEITQGMSPSGNYVILKSDFRNQEGQLVPTFRVLDVTDPSHSKEIVCFGGVNWTMFSFTVDDRYLTADNSISSEAYWLDLQTGDQQIVHLLRDPGKEKMPRPDPLGNGIYYFYKGQVLFRDFQTGFDTVVADVPYRNYVISPDGTTLLFVEGPNDGDLIAQVIATGEQRVIRTDVKSISVNSGYLLVEFSDPDSALTVVGWEEASVGN